MRSDKREKLIDSALELFSQKGFSRTATSDITKRAGVATGTLFNYFPSKDDLIINIYRQSSGKLCDELRQARSNEGRVKDSIQHIWFSLISWNLKEKDRYHFMKYCETMPELKGMGEDRDIKMEPLRGIMKEAIESGLVKDLPEELLLSIFLTTAEALTSYLLDHPDCVDDQDLWERTFSASWDSLR